MKTEEAEIKDALTIGKMEPEDSILSICIDSDTNQWVKLQYNGEVIYEDKSEFKKAAIVFWEVLKMNGLPVSKYNSCENTLEFKFTNGSLKMCDGLLICENIPPITYEMFYYIVEEYKKRIRDKIENEP